MKSRTILLALIGLSAGWIPAPSQARDRGGSLGDILPYLRAANPKAELIARTARIHDRVIASERERRLSRSDASSLSRRLRRVEDFIRNDRHLSDSEYRRRSGDLDKIEADLDRKDGRYRDRERRQ